MSLPIQTTQIFGSNILNMALVTDPSQLYGYEPSMPLAIIGIILSLGVTLITVIQFFHNKTWCFWPMIIGALSKTYIKARLQGFS